MEKITNSNNYSSNMRSSSNMTIDKYIQAFYHARPSYLMSLLHPECVRNSRVSGLSDLSIAIHRKRTIVLPTNASGNMSIAYVPGCFDDSASPTSITVNNDVTYTNTEGSNLNFQGRKPTQQLGIGVGRAWRCVSASMHIIPQTTVLNLSGIIHGSVAPIKPSDNMVNAGSNALVSFPQTYITNMENTRIYNYASVTASQSLRLLWTPYDNCDIEFVPFGAVNPDDVGYGLFATITGTQPAAPFRIDIYENYEILPQAGTILAGTEDFTIERTFYRDVWWVLLNEHINDLVSSGASLSTSVVNSYDESIKAMVDQFSNATLNEKVIDKEVKKDLKSKKKEKAKKFKSGIINRDGINYIMTEG